MDKIQVFILVAPVLLFSMVAHEYAHGYAALKQGDPTAYQLGRLTWNPIKHIDPFMTVIVPIMTYIAFPGMIFGGAKPVPVNPRNYRRYKQGDIIVSMAGVVVNMCIAIGCALLIVPVGMLGRAMPGLENTAAIAQAMLFIGVMFNLVLVFFNLLPIPPLDGSHVFKYLLPPSWALQYQRIGFIGIFIIIILLNFVPQFRVVFQAPVIFLLELVDQFTGQSMLDGTWRILRNAGFVR